MVLWSLVRPRQKWKSFDVTIAWFNKYFNTSTHVLFRITVTVVLDTYRSNDRRRILNLINGTNRCFNVLGTFRKNISWTHYVLLCPTTTKTVNIELQVRLNFGKINLRHVFVVFCFLWIEILISIERRIRMRKHKSSISTWNKCVCVCWFSFLFFIV